MAYSWIRTRIAQAHPLCLFNGGHRLLAITALDKDRGAEQRYLMHHQNNHHHQIGHLLSDMAPAHTSPQAATVKGEGDNLWGEASNFPSKRCEHNAPIAHPSPSSNGELGDGCAIGALCSHCSLRHSGASSYLFLLLSTW